jgi:hypothetical protein
LPLPVDAPTLADAELPPAEVTAVPAFAPWPWPPPVLMERPDPVVITVDFFVDAAVVALEEVVVVPPAVVVDVGVVDVGVVDAGGV